MDRALFQRRRRGVMQLMGEGVAVVPTSPVHVRNSDVLFDFRPDSDFYYLTHFPEPEAVMVLAPGRPEGEFVLFCRAKDPLKETWDGYRAGIEGAINDYDADESYPIDRIDEILPTLIANQPKVYCNMGRYPEFDRRLINWVNEVKSKARSGVHAPTEFVDLPYILHELRLVKRSEEIRVMKRAAKVSASAHRRAMQACAPGKFEYEIAAELEYEFRRSGCQGPAYPSIVAGGDNACVLHYIDNKDELNDGDLLLIDAGAELDCYAADITRTFPVNGKYTADQRIIYDIVLAAQHAAMDCARTGCKWNEPHEAAVRVLSQGLIDIGALSGDVDAVIESADYRRFYMHRTGHWLGMDVHDVGDYMVDDVWRVLEPGMILTVEPGLYFNPSDDTIDPRWRGIGIRIEDDVLITKEGNEVLTSDVPKAAEDIEALMAS